MQFLKADTAATVLIGPFLDMTNGVTPETGVTLGAADSAEIMKHDGTTFVDISALTFTHKAHGMYTLVITSGHLDTEGRLTVFVSDESLCLPVWAEFMVVNANVYDSLFAAATTDYLQSHTVEMTAGVIAAGTLGADCITAAKIAPDAIEANMLNTGAITADAFAANALVAATFNADCITNAKIADNALNTENFAADFLDATLIADDAIVAANLATGALTADAFAADALVAATFATGALTADAFAANALVAATFAADFLTAAKINTGALTADAFAADALVAATFATGAFTADAFAANALVAATFNADCLTAAKIAADVHTENAAAVWAATEAITGDTHTYSKLLTTVFMFLFHEMNIVDANGNMVVRNSGDTGDVISATITDDDTDTLRTKAVIA